MGEGRWPANVILSPEMARALDQQSGNRPGFSGGGATPGDTGNAIYGKGWKRSDNPQTFNDSGGASRFFLEAGYETDELAWIYSVGLRPYTGEHDAG